MVSHTDMWGSRTARRRPPRRWGRWLALAFALVITAAIVYVCSAVGVAVTQVSEPLPPEVKPEARPVAVQAGQRVNILVLGLDDDKLRSDVMMLISIDPESQKAVLLQIPRDTRALLAGKGAMEKINGAYAAGVGDRQFPANLRALKSVEDLVDVSVHYTVVIDLEGFRKAVDELGGVTIDIPRKMDYDDPTQNLQIHLEPGRQKLTGKQALEFVRWRRNNDGTGYPDGDLGRIRAQQQFLSALMDQMFKPSNLLSLPNQLVGLSRYITTTMESSRILSLAKTAATMKRQDVQFATLPGTDGYLSEGAGQGLSYYFMDPVATRKLVDRSIRDINPTVASGVRVAVTGSDQAPALVDRLVSQGFQAAVGTARETGGERTRIIDLKGDAGKAQLVARSLASLGYAVEIVSQPDQTAAVDIRVIVGPSAPVH